MNQRVAPCCCILFRFRESPRKERRQESEKIAARIDYVSLWMRDITVQHVATPRSRVRRDFASGAVRLVKLLPLQLRPLEVAQPFPHAVGGELKQHRPGAQGRTRGPGHKAAGGFGAEQAQPATQLVLPLALCTALESIVE